MGKRTRDSPDDRGQGSRAIQTAQPTIPTLGIPDFAEVKAIVQALQRFKKELMTEGEDYIVQAGKQYTARSGFAKLALGFNLSDEILEEREVYRKGDFFGFDFTVRVFQPSSGRSAVGVGSCTILDESIVSKQDSTPGRASYHDVRATAHTRAINRAISNIIGSAEVSAEEMGHESRGRSQKESLALPEGFGVPEWDFVEELKMQGWEHVETILIAWIRDSGLDHATVFGELEHDSLRCWIRPRAWLGDSFGDVSRMLDGAGFKWRSSEKRWVLSKPEDME